MDDLDQEQRRTEEAGEALERVTGPSAESEAPNMDKDKKSKGGDKAPPKKSKKKKLSKKEEAALDASDAGNLVTKLGNDDFSGAGKVLVEANHPGPLIAKVGLEKFKKVVATLGNVDQLKRLFDATPDGEVDKLSVLFAKRFDMKVGKTLSTSETGEDWDAKGLRRCWDVLEKLPAEHVAGNTKLAHWTRYKDVGSSGSGYYSSARKESSLGYDSDHIDDKNTAADKGDTLYKVTRFNKVVRHEVGHAVDDKIGGIGQYCLGKADGGDWTSHGTATLDLVTAMIAASGGAISKLKKAEHKDAIANAILVSMKGDPEKAQSGIRKLDLFKGDKPALDADTMTAVLNDPVVLTAKHAGKGKSPWYTLNGLGVNVGGRHYQTSYGTTWVSYARAALAKKVSTYQFRAPGEWFAEAYAAYFEPDKKGRVGTLLNKRDPVTKTWFDNNVAPREDKEGK